MILLMSEGCKSHSDNFFNDLWYEDNHIRFRQRLNGKRARADLVGVTVHADRE